jgi:hypothetical protein
VISRRTIFSLLLALIIVVVLRAWLIDHRDNCDRYMAGDRTVPPSEYIESGTRTVEVPCNEWLLRQPAWVQGVCLLDLTVLVVFALSGWQDAARRYRLRRRKKG